jgi:hypothetical protein
MAWLESHQTLANHPKTLKLARLLNVPRVTAVGHLHFLWWWALDYAQDGDLSKFDEMDIAVAADWQGEPDVLLAGLKRAGFVNEDGRIHDWYEYTGRLIERRRADAERKREARSKDVQRPSAGHPEDGVRNRTVPNTTVPNPTRTQPNQPAVRVLRLEYPGEFETFWGAVVRKEPSKAKAFEAWQKAQERTEATPAQIQDGLRRIAPIWEQFDDPSKIPHITTWLNQDRWTVEHPTGPSRASPGNRPPPITSEADAIRAKLRAEAQAIETTWRTR